MVKTKKSRLNAINFIFLGILVLSLPSFGQTMSKKQTSNGNKKELTSTEIKISDHWIKILLQADSLQNQIWKVLIASQTNKVTPFKVVAKALSQATKVKLDLKTSCNQFDLAISSPKEIAIVETCLKKRKDLGTFLIESDQKARLVISTEGFIDDLGIPATILTKEITCDFIVGKRKEFLKMNCQKWTQAKDTENAYVFETFQYDSQRNPTVFVSGKIYESLAPMKSFEITVPKTGAIKIQVVQIADPTPIDNVSETVPREKKMANGVNEGQAKAPTGPSLPIAESELDQTIQEQVVGNVPERDADLPENEDSFFQGGVPLDNEGNEVDPRDDSNQKRQKIQPIEKRPEKRTQPQIPVRESEESL